HGRCPHCREIAAWSERVSYNLAQQRGGTEHRAYPVECAQFGRLRHDQPLAFACYGEHFFFRQSPVGEQTGCAERFLVAWSILVEVDGSLPAREGEQPELTLTYLPSQVRQHLFGIAANQPLRLGHRHLPDEEGFSE